MEYRRWKIYKSYYNTHWVAEHEDEELCKIDKDLKGLKEEIDEYYERKEEE
jgi:hypothetical protein